MAVCDLPHGLGEVGWPFAAVGAFGLRPAGPGAPAGATLATLGTADVGAVDAAGVVLGATSIAAVLVYGCATILSGRDRAEVRLAAVEVEGAEA